MIEFKNVSKHFGPTQVLHNIDLNIAQGEVVVIIGPSGHQRYLCSHCRKTWQLQFTYTASQPGTHQKIIDMAMNGVGCRATARIMGVGLNTILRHLKNSGRSR